MVLKPKISEKSHAACECALCKNNKIFQRPKHLIEELEKGNVVIFAGAGISTENRDVAVSTFYDKIAGELGGKDRPSFSVLMEKYCRQPDGRIKLIRSIKDRFDYFRSFGAFYNDMTRFHRAIAPLFMITEIITTNWDDFFERECDVDAFVADTDMPFWGASSRKLMKIHGPIRNFGSIVATEADYLASYSRLNDGPMGAMLKTIPTQKTVIYTGYSLSDDNFVRLANNIARMASPYLKQSYFVAPSIDHEKLNNFSLPLIPIETDGAFFFEQIRLHLAKRCGIVEESAFDACKYVLSTAKDKHSRASDAFLKTLKPLLVFTLSYQDGLIDGLLRIIDRHKSGEYHSSDHLLNLIRGYSHKAADYKRENDEWNNSYVEGYRTAVMYLFAKSSNSNLRAPPMYGCYKGKELNSLSDVLRYPVNNIKRAHLAQATRIIDRCRSAKQPLIIHHIPYV